VPQEKQKHIEISHNEVKIDEPIKKNEEVEVEKPI